jgi:hypothetical protein
VLRIAYRRFADSPFCGLADLRICLSACLPICVFADLRMCSLWSGVPHMSHITQLIRMLPEITHRVDAIIQYIRLSCRPMCLYTEVWPWLGQSAVKVVVDVASEAALGF